MSSFPTFSLDSHLPIEEPDKVSDAPVEPPPEHVTLDKLLESGGSERDIQRAALRELVTLASESAAEESDIEREYRSTLEQAKQQFADGGFQIEDRFKKAQDDAVKSHEQRLLTLGSQYKAETSKITAADKTTRQKLDAEKSDIDQKLKKKLDQAVWLADSVYDLAQGQVAIAYKQKTEEIAGAIEALNGMEVQAAQLLQRYAVALPQGQETVAEDPQIAVDADAAFTRHREAVEKHLKALQRQPIANLFVGARPYLIPLLLMIVAAIATQYHFNTTDPQWKPLGIMVGATFVVIVGLEIVLRMMATKSVRSEHTPLRQELVLARQSAEKQAENALAKRKADAETATRTRDAEVAAAREQITPHAQKAAKTRETGLINAKTDFTKQIARLDQLRDKAKTDADESRRKKLQDLEVAHERDVKELRSRFESRVAVIEQKHTDRWATLEQRWAAGLAKIQTPIAEHDGGSAGVVRDWKDPFWRTWTPSKKFTSRVRFGEMHVDLKTITDNVPQRLKLPDTFSLPALLAFPSHASLVIHHDHASRGPALSILKMMMSRLLTSLPAGRVKFTMIDPIGLGDTFGGFMHLEEYDPALVGGKIWTTQEQVDQQLTNLVEHMETVIQKYLRNEFKTIDDYNAQAAELAEPYRILVVADLPVNFSVEAFKKLTSIAASGARCGVYVLIARDIRHPLPSGAHLDELEANAVNLVREGEKFVWQDEIFRQLPLDLDVPPGDEDLTQILHKVGAGAKEAKRVEVSFDLIAPPKDEIWSKRSSSELDVPVGRQGANRSQSMKLGRGVAQHVLIAGKTGSGKSTLLHAMITNAAMWYSPDEVELYLIDFKKGVEFKTYAEHSLAHCRAIAVESDREFGISVLQRLDAELSRRGELFRKASVQDLGAYRKTPDPLVVPRTLLIIDEFQEFFSEDDKLAQEASLLIDRLVRQGRAFGIHVILGSQSIGGAGGLPRTTLGQMAVRIALQTTEADSQLILGDNNSAARLLTRPGEAIYNDVGGLVEGNSPFQVAWLPDSKRDGYLNELTSRAAPYLARFGQPIVFEGNAAADIRRNPLLAAAINARSWSASPQPPSAWVGEPVAIKDPTALILRRQAGSNVLMVGQQEEQALSMMVGMILSIASQLSPQQASFYVLDGTPADSALAGSFDRIKAALPHEMKMIEFRATPEAVDELATEMQRRQDGETGPSIFVFIYGLQRYRVLRKQEEEFSFSSSSDEPKKPNPGKQFGELLREGPPNGIHVLAWCDTLVSLDRTLDRGSMREFDNRVLFQMSAADSSNLIDSPSANKLGFFRSLVYSEEQGTMERFRPYGVPDAEWLAQIKTKLTARTTA